MGQCRWARGGSANLCPQQSRAHAPWLVACDSRGAPGRLRARGSSRVAPCGTGAGCQRRTRAGGWCALRPETRCCPLRALPLPRHLDAARPPSDSRLLIRLESQRGQCAPPDPPAAPISLLLGKRNQSNDRLHLRFSFFCWQVLLHFSEPQHLVCKMELTPATLRRGGCEG